MLLICGTVWVLISQFSDFSDKLQSYGLPDPAKYNDCTTRYSTKDCSMYEELVNQLESRWAQYFPIVITGCVIAILVGISQLGISLTVSYSNPKVYRCYNKNIIICSNI